MGLRPLLSLTLLLAAGSARGGSTPCSSCAPPPPCNCAPTSHQVKVPGVSISTPQINIGMPNIGFGGGGGFGAGGASASGVGTASAEAGGSSNISVSVQTSGSSNASGQNTAGLLGSFGGGGSASWTPEASVTTEISEVKIESAAVPVPPQPVCLAWKAVTRQVAIQAMCLDDKSVPHPASQVSPERMLAPGYEGEVFRCIAGAKMQYTIADFAGQADFTHGQTIVCHKGEALYHSGSGALQCRPQTPARDCNERSLLRRFGAGIKVMAMSGERQCVQWGAQTVAAAPPPPRGPMVLN